jgi:hypothetical protein
VIFPGEEPQLAAPLPLSTRQPARFAPALLLLGLIAGAVGMGYVHRQSEPAPWTPEQLSPNVVALVSPDNDAGIKSAVAALKVSESQRLDIEQALIERRQRIGWIVFTDSMDPDGDAIAVEASGLTQEIVLTKGWTPVAVLPDGAPIRVTAIRDGEGGGVTIAFATSAGTMPMRILRPGEQIEVVP